MRAVILAGGEGVRLRPYTTCLPKPLVPVGNEVTMIEILLRQLKAQGFSEVSLALGHMGHLIEAFVGDGSRWGLQISCWHEDRPLGTAGPLLYHLDDLPEHFVVLNADLLCDIDMADMLQQHRLSGASLTIASSSRRMKVDFGVLAVEGARLQSFEEKPQLSFEVSMGIYCISRSLLGQAVPRRMGFDDLLRGLLAQGDAPFVYRFDGYWLDIGRPEDYDRANRDFPELRNRLWRLSDDEDTPTDLPLDLTSVASLRSGAGSSLGNGSNGTGIDGADPLP